MRDTESGKDHPGSATFLEALNPAQLKAVTADPSVPLQILAGPGSGKTRVLTSRVAYLVKHHGYKPMQIVAVTFTNKAANEMKKRLTSLLGSKAADALVLGTFHATCARYLRRYGQLIGLPNNFAIADADDCKKIISGLLKAKAEIIRASQMSLKDSGVLSEISKAKAKEEDPEGMAVRAARDPNTSTSTLAIIAELYAEYEATLREANSLDFDDLLVFGLRLFRDSPRILESCRHILVDEFQDTNTTQYELMKCFAKAHGGVSVVGDPDQSIYGWRSAEVENLNKMITDFPGVQAIHLEENYRSTGSILHAAHSVVSQDRNRIPKNLYTSHPKSTTVTLKVFSTPVIEASFIATEIKRLIAYSGNVLNHGDFAVLLRSNALSRNIEAALQKDSIPNRVVGGHKFFERMEVKDLLAYLQLADNPNFLPAFLRVVNVPRRAIGDKSVADLLAAAKAEKLSPMELSESIIDGAQLPEGFKPAMKKNLANFVGVVRKVRRAAEKRTPVAELLRVIIQKIGYEEFLRTSQQDFDSRWENVQELISFSVVVAEEQRRSMSETDDGFISTSTLVNPPEAESPQLIPQRLHPMFRRMSSGSTTTVDSRPTKKRKRTSTRSGDDGVIELLSSDDESAGSRLMPAGDGRDISPAGQVQHGSMTPLSFFLQTSMLSTDTDSEKDIADQPKVTITTVHAAKGLEWPVVFIPAVEQGTYPSYRCTEAHEIAEERRLLYVAMTRAQLFLTLSHCHFRMMGGEENDKSLSEFIISSQKKDPASFSASLPEIDVVVRTRIAAMLGRPPADEAAIKEAIMKHVRAAPPLSMWDPPEPRDRQFNRFARREVTKAARAAEYWASDQDDYALPDQISSKSTSNPHRRSHEPWRASDEGFKTSREAMVPSPEKKPPKIVQPTRVDMPTVLPFTFGEPDLKPTEQSLGAFTNASSSSLSFMRNLGLPGETGSIPSSPVSSPHLGPNGFDMGLKARQTVPGVGGFQSASAGGLAAMKNLGLPAPQSGGGFNGMGSRGVGGIKSGGAGTGQGLGQGVKLAQGTKRLGMGRPAPWGSKKSRTE
ncbi:hypothetical protein M231_06854 [Tremella mesenterica]|uniref:DNA 3'-5' helicase n=1 Tax=Tremella mesenterica TaxID=5217 RepID=A0A4V1M375_TREME|nr:hypothetical protein M231_06854 [Tremella mesenterica]